MFIDSSVDVLKTRDWEHKCKTELRWSFTRTGKFPPAVMSFFYQRTLWLCSGSIF